MPTLIRNLAAQFARPRTVHLGRRFADEPVKAPIKVEAAPEKKREPTANRGE